ncbi:MAG: SDR family NAD(P)-dependent oxidoreductase, partial [Actinomycetota bacterium]
MRSEDRLFDVRDRVAIITGASGGLGERFARVLHGRGAHVVLAARRPERLDAIAASLPGSLGIVCDVGLEADRNRVVTSALDTFGKLDILVNNAGISGAPVPAERMPLDRWDRTLSVNLSGLFGMTQAAAQSMLAAGSGSIINIGSVFGLVANAPVTDVAYA